MKNETLEHNQMKFLRGLGIDTSDASLVKLYKKESDNTVVSWNTICSDRNGLFVYTDERRESVSTHFYEANSNDYDHSLREENGVYTTDDLLKKLPQEIKGSEGSYYLDMKTTEEGYIMSYLSLDGKTFNSEYIEGITLKDTAYNTLLTLAEEKENGMNIDIPLSDTKSMDCQYLTQDQMRHLEGLGIDISDAPVVVSGNGIKSYTTDDLLAKLPATLYAGGELYHRDLTLCNGKEFTFGYKSHGDFLPGMKLTSKNIKYLLYNELSALAEKGLWNGNGQSFDKNIGSVLQQLVSECNAGKISLEQAAQKLHQSGFTDFVDAVKTDQLLRAWKESHPSEAEDVVIIRSGNKTLVVGEKTSTLCYNNILQQMPILSDFLSINHLKPSDINGWNNFLNGNTIILNKDVAISLYKGAGGYTVKSFSPDLFGKKYQESEGVIVSEFKNGKFEELRMNIVNIDVCDYQILDFLYHVEHGNKEIEDNSCSTGLKETLSAFGVKDVEELKQRLGDGRLEGNIWNGLVKELSDKNISISIDESGKYIDVDEYMIPEY